jgi:hypothetical protein
MQNQGGTTNSDSGRTAIDRHAVIAAGHVLMSAIWLEHRARVFSTRLWTLPTQRASFASVPNFPASPQPGNAESPSFLTVGRSVHLTAREGQTTQ